MPRHDTRHRVVVTGLGVVSPLGLNVDDTWAGLVAGRSGVGPVTQFDATDYACKINASVKGFEPTHFVNVKEARRMAVHTQYGIAAMSEALANAGLELAKEDCTRVGISLGSALGGIPLIEEQVVILNTRGQKRINPTFVPAVLINMTACHMAVTWGVKGPVHSPVAACATGVVAIGEAFRLMQRGDADVMIAGGAESTMTPIGFASFGRLGALSSQNDDPSNACRPFDALRDGTIIGEGAAVLVLETLAHARQRDASILCEIAGYGLTEDAYHLVMPDPSGEGAARAIQLALQDADWRSEEVGYICAHGTGTPLNDAAETRAIKLALEEHAFRVPISSNKSMVGHMMGAAGAFSAFVTVKTITDGLITPTSNLRNPDPECDLDFTPLVSRHIEIRKAMVNGFGFGGQNATLALQAFPA